METTAATAAEVETLEEIPMMKVEEGISKVISEAEEKTIFTTEEEEEEGGVGVVSEVEDSTRVLLPSKCTTVQLC